MTHTAEDGTPIITHREEPPQMRDFKSGTISSVSEGGTASVAFNTPFADVPQVVLNFEGNVDHVAGEKGAALSVYSITTVGFTVRYDAASATVDPATNVQWIATSAGNA